MFLDIIHCLVQSLKTQRFGDWILSPSSGKIFLSWVQSIEIDIASPYLRTPTPAPKHDRIYKQTNSLSARKIKIGPACIWRKPQNMLNGVKVLETEPNITYRKYKESVHMSLVVHPIGQTSLDVSPIWTAIIAEVRKLQLRTA
jgi:hypothetical protein